MEASEVIREVQRNWEALYAKKPVNLPAFERLVRSHIPWGVPEEWRSVQDYTLQDPKEAVKEAVADDKAPRSNSAQLPLLRSCLSPCKGSRYTLRGPSSMVRRSRSHGMRPPFG